MSKSDEDFQTEVAERLKRNVEEYQKTLAARGFCACASGDDIEKAMTSTQPGETVKCPKCGKPIALLGYPVVIERKEPA